MILIDPIKVYKELHDEMAWPGRHPEFISAIECAMADVSDIPRIEAEPVIHAEWKYEDPCPSDYDEFWTCSNCGEHMFYQSNYCPSCGAKMTEWFVHIWGGAWNHDATPSIEKDLGIKPGAYYFKSEKEKDAFITQLRNPIYYNQGLMIHVEEGIFSHKRTIFVGTFKYKGKEFVLHQDMGPEYPEDSAIFMFTDGNYGCDCNRSLFIQREHGEDAIPDLGCGCEIELVDYHFEYKDVEE